MAPRSILITGCSSGIGRDAAYGLRTRGWQVFAACRKEADCRRLRDDGFAAPRIDHTDPDSIASGLAQVLDATGGSLDALYNNAAYACPGRVEDLPRGALHDIFDANLFGLHDLTIRVLPVMRAQGHGRIVNCSSVLGLVGLEMRGAYVATKFALEGLTDVLRLEMRGTGIHICLLEPGPIASKIRENAIPHFEKWFEGREFARPDRYAILRSRLYTASGPDRFELPASAVTRRLIHAIESPRPRPRYYITTPTRIAGVLRRLLPTRALDWLAARV